MPYLRDIAEAVSVDLVRDVTQYTLEEMHERNS